MNKTATKLGLVGLYVGSLLLPAWAFFDARGGTVFLQGLGPRDSMRILFPLLGLYAFMLIVWQILVATNLRWLTRLWPRIINFHRFQGGLALALAIFHPLTIMIGFGLATYIERKFVAPSQAVYLLPAYLGLMILITTVVTASMAWYGSRLTWWRQLHRLNYVAFVLFWAHSWFIGTDTRLFPLKLLWIMAPLVIAVSIILCYKDDFLRWLETTKPANN